jgi:hypothetical protein
MFSCKKILFKIILILSLVFVSNLFANENSSDEYEKLRIKIFEEFKKIILFWRLYAYSLYPACSI